MPLNQHRAQHGRNINVLGWQYSYDPVGNITSISDVLRGAYTETYDYNAVGNMTSKAGVTYSYTDTLHRHAVTALSDGSAYQYDRNGNMTQRVEAGISYTQTWDIDNRLTSVTKGNWTTQYYYDADGALVRKTEPRGSTIYGNSDYEVFYPTVVTVTIPSTFTHRLYMPFVSFAPTSGACRDTCTYYQFNGQQVAVRTGGTLYWLHGDHLGSASATTDINGTKVSELRYKPYGETRYSNGTTPTDKRFTSHEQDSYSNIYEMGARRYSPLLGQFISPDTIVQDPYDPQSLNRYSYARSNPLKYIDPSGHCFLLAGLDTMLCVATWMMIVGGTGMATAAVMNTPAGRQAQVNAQHAASQMIVQADSALKVQAEAANSENAANKSVSPSDQTGSPTGPNDPNGNKHEANFRQRFIDRGYQQPFGDNDQSIARNLGIKGRVADHVFWDQGTNTYIVAESKAGSDVTSAVEQLSNTSRGLFNSNWSASASNTRLIFNTNQETFLGLLRNQTGSSMYGGYGIQGGYLSYWDTATNTWIQEIVNGLRIAVTASP